MRKGIQILLRVTGAILIFLILFIIAIPLFFKDALIETVRREVDQRIEGAFYFEKADVGILRTFPNLCLTLTRPVLTGAFHPQGDSLFKAGSLDVVVDVMSLIKSDRPVKVIGIAMEDPVISIFVDAQGANYALVPDTSTTAADSPGTDSLVIEIDQYSIENGMFRYIDRTAEIDIAAEQFNHSGRLKSVGNRIEIRSETGDGILTVSYAGIPYLDRVRVSGKNDIDLDLDNETYTLLENHLVLNALPLDAGGTIALTEESTVFDLTFHAQRGAFKNLISLLPNMYTADFNAVRASGDLAFEGSLAGTLTDTEVPVYRISLKVDEGAFQYPGKPLGFADVKMGATLANRNTSWMPADIHIEALHFLLNKRPFDMVAQIRDPGGEATYRGSLKGILDLADFAKAYPLPDVSQLAGIINADIEFDIATQKRTEEQMVSGKLAMQDIRVSTDDQTLAVPVASLEFNPRTIHCVSQGAEWNGSPVHIDLTLQNAVAWLTQDDQILDVAGSLTLGTLNVNPYLDMAEPTTASDTSAMQDGSISLIRFDTQIAIDSFIYEDYVIENGRATVQGTLSAMRAPHLEGTIRGTHFQANGHFSNIDSYLKGATPLTGTLDCRMDKIYVDNWIEADTTAAAAAADEAVEYVALPDDINLAITFQADAAYYDKIDIRNPQGKCVLHDRILEIENFRGNAFGGNMAFSGIYNTQDIVHPAFNMKYEMASLKFGEAFREIETFQALAPVVRFIEGIFNSTLVMEGRLGKQYMPDFSTLTASGFLETVNGKMQQTGFLDKLSAFLNLKEPLDFDLGKTRNWFEVKDGYVILQEVEKKVGDIEMAFGGRHQIMGDMDYLIKLNIPADKITSNPVGALAKEGYEELRKRASAVGIQLNTIENFIVHVSAQGKYADPKFSIKFFDASGKSLKDVASEELTRLTEQAKDTISAIAEEKLQEARDSIMKTLEGKIDSAKLAAEQQLKEAGKELVGRATEKIDSTMRDSLLNVAGEKAKEILGEKADKPTEKIKDVLDKWDPLKKKKKD